MYVFSLLRFRDAAQVDVCVLLLIIVEAVVKPWELALLSSLWVVAVWGAQRKVGSRAQMSCASSRYASDVCLFSVASAFNVLSQCATERHAFAAACAYIYSC